MGVCVSINSVSTRRVEAAKTPEKTAPADFAQQARPEFQM
jgi:hypothetical protein